MVDPRNWEGRVEDNIRRDGQGTRKQRQNVEQVLQKKGRRTGTEYSVVCGVVHEEEAGGEREERKKKKKKKKEREKVGYPSACVERRTYVGMPKCMNWTHDAGGTHR